MYKSNYQNDDFSDLPFDGDEMLITIRQIYCINDNTGFRLNNYSSVGVKMNWM